MLRLTFASFHFCLVSSDLSTGVLLRPVTALRKGINSFSINAA